MTLNDLFWSGVAFLGALFLVFVYPADADPRNVFRPVTGYSVAYTGSPGTAASAIGSQNRVVRVLCTTDCWVAFTPTPIVAANTNPVRLEANREEYFRVTPGIFVRVVRDASDGTIYVTEME